MKKIFKSLIMLVLAGAVLTGCNEDKFLTISSPTEVSDADFPTTFDQAQSLLTAAYAQLHDSNFMGSVWGGYVVYPLEYDVDFAWRDSQEWVGEVARTNDGPSDRVSASWSPINKGIHYCNIAIEGVREYEKIASATEMSTLKNFEGEALYLRAYYWWHLLEVYGQPQLDGIGIPILEHSAASYADAQIGRSSTKESYEAMVRTLEEAIPLLEGQSNKYRADKWAAKGLLAKVYFFMGESAKAKSVLEDIFKNSGKSLVSFSHMKRMFNGDSAYEHSSESFFEIENVLGGTAYAYNRQYKVGSEWSRWDTHCSLSTKGKRSSMDNANLIIHDKNLARFGFTEPTYAHYMHQEDVLPEDGWIPFNQESYGGYYLEKSYIEKLDAMKTRCHSGNAEAGDPDPRFYVNVLYPMVDSCKNNDGTWAPISPNMRSEDGGNLWWTTARTGDDRLVDHAASIRKYKFLDGTLTGNGHNCSGENIIFMRLPELYLIYAQICKDAGESDTALEYVNKVHRRAYGKNPNSSSAVDYKSLADRTKTASSSDQLANDPIKYELWAELFAECKWIDYIRYYSLGPGEASYYEKVHGPSNAGVTYCKFTDRDYAQPIPRSEIELNPNMKQTPGYQE